MEHNFKWKNDGRTKVMIGCGTRPEIIRLAAVIKRCREYFDCCVVYYNQNWDRNLSTVFWEDFELKNTFGEYGPDILVPVVGENLGVTCGNIMGRSYELLSELQPEGYLVLGDTNSCLSAISAKRLHIPLFHMEAGNRCKDECLPEETNRRIVDVISDVNSIKYFRKSKNLTIFAQTNKALVEVQKMLIKLPEALSASNSSRRGKKGLSLHNTLCDIGQELNANLTEINSNIPTEYSDAIRQLQNKDGFNLQAYINSYISGEAVQNNGIDSDDFNVCQARLLEIQDYLKKSALETEEKLK